MERRFVPSAGSIRLETRADKLPLIVGVGAVFFAADDPGSEFWLYSDLVERVMPAAFNRAMGEDDVRALFNHDPNNLLGRTASRTMKLASNGKGLAYEIDPPDTPAARAVIESIRRGDLTGSSFAFIPRKTVWVEEVRDKKKVYVRELHDVELFDVGPVTYPAYKSTSTGVRSAEGGDLVRAELDAWIKFRSTDSTDAARKVFLENVNRRARAVSID